MANGDWLKDDMKYIRDKVDEIHKELGTNNEQTQKNKTDIQWLSWAIRLFVAGAVGAVFFALRGI